MFKKYFLACKISTYFSAKCLKGKLIFFHLKYFILSLPFFVYSAQIIKYFLSISRANILKYMREIMYTHADTHKHLCLIHKIVKEL